MQYTDLTMSRPTAAAVHQAARRLRARAMRAWLLNLRPLRAAGGSLATLSRRELADIGMSRDYFAAGSSLGRGTP